MNPTDRNNKYKLIIASSVVVEAKDFEGAKREFEATQEVAKDAELGEGIVMDLLLNSEIVAVTNFKMEHDEYDQISQDPKDNILEHE